MGVLSQEPAGAKAQLRSIQIAAPESKRSANALLFDVILLAYLAFAVSTTALNALASRTARSASILRLMRMSAIFMS